MLQEQRELRSFITSLRSGPLVALNDLARDLKSLADRLSKQWDVRCEFSSRPAEMMIPTRLHLDAHQLMREAVANAVRHAKANSVTVGLAAAADRLQLEIVNDGADFPSSRRPARNADFAEGAGRAGRRGARHGAGNGGDQNVDLAADRRGPPLTRLLLADDHPMIRTALEVLLRDTEYEIVGTAATGEATLGEVDRLRPDILLLDLQMPGGTGMDVLRRARAEKMPLGSSC